jgi:hypothetical protein
MSLVRPKLQSLLSLLLIVSIVSGHGLLLGGCSALFSSPSSASVAPGTHCPMTYGATGQHAGPAHDCPMHKATATQHDELRCQCDQHADARTADLSTVRFVLPEAPLLTSPSVHWQHCTDASVFLPVTFLLPPDPPPRHGSLVSA